MAIDNFMKLRLSEVLPEYHDIIRIHFKIGRYYDYLSIVAREACLYILCGGLQNLVVFDDLRIKSKLTSGNDFLTSTRDMDKIKDDIKMFDSKTSKTAINISYEKEVIFSIEIPGFIGRGDFSDEEFAPEIEDYDHFPWGEPLAKFLAAKIEESGIEEVFRKKKEAILEKEASTFEKMVTLKVFD